MRFLKQKLLSYPKIQYKLVNNYLKSIVHYQANLHLNIKREVSLALYPIDLCSQCPC